MATPDNDNTRATTPPGSNQRAEPLQVSEETPRIVRSSGNQLTVTENRDGIAEQMDQEMLICSLEDFQRTYLPFIPSDEDIRKCAQQLEEFGLFEKKENAYSWNIKAPDEEGAGPETEAFKFLAKFAAVISRHKFSRNHDDRTKQARLVYQDCPNRAVRSELYGADFKNDACLKLTKWTDPKMGVMATTLTKKVAASDIVVAAEYKKSGNDAVDNRRKLLSAANHILNEDPRRVFMFGITIEGKNVSLWFFSRSHSTKSHEFNFFEVSLKKLISTFLSFLFGKSDRLGFDEAVRRYARAEKKIYYEYKVTSKGGNRYFRTREALASSRSNRITGRMTRVWRVVEIGVFGGDEIPGKEFALKDVWLDRSAQTEERIQSAIFAAVERQNEQYQQGQTSTLDYLSSWKPERKNKLLNLIRSGAYRDLFMTVECENAEGGAVTASRPVTSTPTRHLFFNSPRGNRVGRRSHLLKGADHSRDSPNPAHLVSTTTEPWSAAIEGRPYEPKRRYLLVYTEVGSALHQLKSFKGVFKALVDITYALAIMYVAGWVHRDISTGNIIVVGSGDSTCGKISDLEYAKVFGSTSPTARDPKTGTPFYMAFELLDNDWLYRKEADPGAIEERINQSLPVTQLLETPWPTVVYNFQYDLESVWWIALWCLLVCVNHPPSRDCAPTIYENTINYVPTERRLIFTRDNYLSKKLQKVLFSKFEPLRKHLVNWRDILYSHYLQREAKDEVMIPVSYAKIFELVITIAEDLCKDCSGIEDLPAFIPPRNSADEPPFSSTSGFTNISETPATPPSSKRSSSQRPASDHTDEAENSSVKRPRSDGPAVPGLFPQGYLNHRSPVA
ncbi:hypothetical protein AN958_09648 [Leucoagaricus sp. SymC.cos]|nr:hypothetical protein AN958_09648 [Leucoagaricus sp. SymC.cos]